MKAQLIAFLFLLILHPAQGVYADQLSDKPACTELESCAKKAASDVDDGNSSSAAIAKPVSQICHALLEKCVDQTLENIKAAINSKEVDIEKRQALLKISDSSEAREDTRKSIINSRIVSSVFEARYAKKQDQDKP